MFSTRTVKCTGKQESQMASTLSVNLTSNFPQSNFPISFSLKNNTANTAIELKAKKIKLLGLFVRPCSTYIHPCSKYLVLANLSLLIKFNEFDTVRQPIGRHFLDFPKSSLFHYTTMINLFMLCKVQGQEKY